jgi:hypothetical protein
VTFGIVNSNAAALDVPVFVTDALEPAAPVTVLGSTVTVAAVPVEPVSPFGPVAPVSPFWAIRPHLPDDKSVANVPAVCATQTHIRRAALRDELIL